MLKNKLKRGLSIVLALVFCMSLFTVLTISSSANASAQAKPVKQLKLPVEDGVYYAQIDLMNAMGNGNTSMGNASLRGSSSFKANQTTDTYDKAIVVVENGKATAIVEFMPMGFLGRCGFLMEIESVSPKFMNESGMPDDKTATFTTPDILSTHKAVDGTPVYDDFNNPDSDFKFDGTGSKRPAGFGHETEREVNIVDKPYTHTVAIDVTPILIGDAKAPATAADYGWSNAAYVHVFVPVMFSISPTTGDQYAKMQVQWDTVEKIENPENNIYYRLWSAKQVKQGSYTDDSFNALQTAIGEVQTELNNIWPAQDLAIGPNRLPVLNQKEYNAEKQLAMADKINDAIANLNKLSADYTKVDEALELIPEDLSIYTEETAQAVIDAENAVDRSQDTDNQEAVDAMAKAIKDAVAALELKPADYSKVDAAIAKVPEDLSVYTEASTAKLNAALKAVIRNKKADEQSLVNKMAKDIEDALAGLKEINPNALDKNNLKDGIYAVHIDMIKMDRVNPSMSNSSVGHTIKLVVKDGKITAFVNFKGVSYLNMFGYLGKLSYYSEGYTYGNSGTISGEILLADVISEQKDTDGNDIYDEFNKEGGIYEGNKYPETVSFPIVPTALADEDGFVPLRVFVPVMESISAGTGTQNVLMKVDWSSLRNATEDDEAFVPEKPVDKTPAVDLVDEESGIKVHGDKGAFEAGVQLVVEEITYGELFDSATEALTDISDKFTLYTVKFVDTDGNEVKPNGNINITFPVPDDYNSDYYAIYRINEDGSKTAIVGDLIDNEYTVLVRGAANYAIAENNHDEVPDTSDFSVIIIAVVAVLALAGVIFLVINMRRRGAQK